MLCRSGRGVRRIRPNLLDSNSKTRREQGLPSHSNPRKTRRPFQNNSLNGAPIQNKVTNTHVLEFLLSSLTSMP